jgi:hypothetical protein
MSVEVIPQERVRGCKVRPLAHLEDHERNGLRHEAIDDLALKPSLGPVPVERHGHPAGNPRCAK